MLPAQRICSILIVLIACLHACRAGEPPAITRLIPAGGQRGTTVDVRLTGKPGDGELKVVSDDDAIVFTLNEKKDSANAAIGAAARPGVHWLRFCNADGATELLPFIVGLIPEVTETEPNARIAEANSVTLPSVTVNGVLEKAGDVDTFAVTLSKGQTIVCSIQARAVIGAPMDAILQISDARGIVLEQNDDDLGFDPRLSFTAPNDGTWYVRTFAFPANPNSTINFAGGADYVYRLTLTTAAVVEHTEPLVRFDQQDESSLTIFGWNIEATTVSLKREQAQLTEPYAVAYPVRSSSIPSIVESQLSADRTIPFPVAVTGHVTSSADAIFLFNATKGQKLSLSVYAQRVGSLLDPVLIVEEGSGKVIQENDDISGANRDAELHLTMPADGQYRLIIRDRFRNFGDRCFYLLRGEETRATFNATITSTSGTLKPDKPLEIPITIDRKHGYSEPVDVRVEGLPEGLAFECPRSEKDGETSKAVTVKISGTATAAFQGPLRIVSESSESKQLQPVTFTTADGGSIAEYWLTAPKQEDAPQEQ
ncbi:MAG: PPC domain-containing protein [Planctomycetaceae bacterium]|nr:PPC domain-containing protein [Planctomycetaceae bacterium]